MIPELLSPAGCQESLEAAVAYGADAVYLGSGAFGMRQGAVFDQDMLIRAVGFAHENGVKVYLCCNTLPTNEEMDCLPEFLHFAGSVGIDALIVADVGVLSLAREILPQMELHASTQTGIVNWRTAVELHRMGAKRVVLARELPLEEIWRIREKTPSSLELEAFVHGSMCMSVSGRCLISNYLTGRDANRGQCAQPCRWSYYLMEETRPGEYFPIFQDEKGSYLLNAKDLCMIEYLDLLAQAGISSFKIEGRAKAAYYTASVTSAYRGALDALARTPAGEPFEPPAWTLEEVHKVSHREYSTGFYFDTPGQVLHSGGYIREWEVIATVESCADGFLTVMARNRFFAGENAELLLPRQAPEPYPITQIFDLEENLETDCACHAMRRYRLPYQGQVPAGSMLRRCKIEKHTKENS